MRAADVEVPVVAAASRTPFESSRRVFVLERVDTMNDTVANRLLKTLEEPASFVHLILLTDALGRVLDTVISRCQLVRFEPLPAARIAAALEAEGVEADVAGACARLALGNAARARLLASPDGASLRASRGGRCSSEPSRAGPRPRTRWSPPASSDSRWSRRAASARRSSASWRRRRSATAAGLGPRCSTWH
jgi:DNA polymerase-3 subunit delta'